jgi:hypothetical protein
LTHDGAAAFEDYVLCLDEFHDLGNGVTLGLLSQRCRPRAGGGLVEEPYAVVVAWKDGLITRVTVYSGIDEGRAAAELLAEVRGRWCRRRTSSSSAAPFTGLRRSE